MSKTFRAGFTVEASLILPIFLGVLAISMKMGIDLHEEIEREKEQVVQLWEVKDFYLYQLVGEVFDD